MIKRTKQELIDTFVEKLENVRVTYKDATFALSKNELLSENLREELRTRQSKSKDYIDAYSEIISLLNSTEIVTYKEFVGFTCTSKDGTCDGDCNKCYFYKPMYEIDKNTPKSKPQNLCIGCKKEKRENGVCITDVNGECPFDGEEAQTPIDEEKEIESDQFREFKIDSFSRNTGITFVNAKQVANITKFKNVEHYISIYLPSNVVTLKYDTEEEQIKAYDELKEWVKCWN